MMREVLARASSGSWPKRRAPRRRSCRWTARRRRASAAAGGDRHLNRSPRATMPNPWPDLVLIDGGEGQLNAAREILAELGIEVPLVAIAKGPDRDAGRETFFIPGRAVQAAAARSGALFRPAAARRGASFCRRFAPGAPQARHREAGLQEIAGIGPTRKRALLHHFGTLKAIERASITDLSQVGYQRRNRPLHLRILSRGERREATSKQPASRIDQCTRSARQTCTVRPCRPRPLRRYGRAMNSTTTTTGRLRAHSFALPNILTYGRIVVIPIVIGCMFWQSILDGPLWLRWVALAFFIAAAISDFLDGYLGLHRRSAILARPHARPDRGQAFGIVSSADVGGGRHHPRLVAVGSDRHPLPRNSGLGFARISCRVARQHTGDASRQMEDDLAARGGRVSRSPVMPATLSFRWSPRSASCCCGCRRC